MKITNISKEKNSNEPKQHKLPVISTRDVRYNLINIMNAAVRYI